MSHTFSVSLVAPSHPLLSFEAVSLRAPGIGGQFGIMANRAPLVAALRIGVVHIVDIVAGDSWFGITGGFLEMIDNKVTILADDLITPGMIPEPRESGKHKVLFKDSYDSDEEKLAFAQELLIRALERDA